MILFVDDEPEYIENYQTALEESNFDVEAIPDVDEALEFVKENSKKIDGIVLDIMMSFGQGFDEKETERGTRTGVVFYKRIRETLPQTPVFVLTNVSDPKVEDFFETEENCYYYFKRKPFEFAKFVRNKLGTS